MQNSEHSLPWPSLYELLAAYEETGRNIQTLNLSSEIYEQYASAQQSKLCALLNKEFVRRYAFSLQPPAGKN